MGVWSLSSPTILLGEWPPKLAALGDSGMTVISSSPGVGVVTFKGVGAATFKGVGVVTFEEVGVATFIEPGIMSLGNKDGEFFTKIVTRWPRVCI